jgi:hypothetical protein
MNTVNTKLQDFYIRGRVDAAGDYSWLIRNLSEKYKDVNLDSGISLQQFLNLMADQLDKHANANWVKKV